MIPAKCFVQIVIPAKANPDHSWSVTEVVEAKASWIPARAALGRNDDRPDSLDH